MSGGHSVPVTAGSHGSVFPPLHRANKLSLPVVNAAGERVIRNLCQIVPVGRAILISHEKENRPKNI